MHDNAQPERRSLIDDLQAGVPPAFAMLAGLQLDLFTALADGPSTAAEVAARLKLDESRLARLMRALTVAGLLQADGPRFANGDEAAARLIRGRPGFVGDIQVLLADIWAADLQTAQSIRSARPASLHDFSAMDEEDLAEFLQSIAPWGRSAAAQIARKFDLSACRSLIDIGGGAGAVLDGLLALYPDMRGTLYDLPSVVKVALRLLPDLDTAERISIEGGDILAAPPKGLHDAALMRSVVQVLSPEEAERAIRHTAAGLLPGGKLFITGSGIIDDGRLAPAEGVYIDLTLMNFYAQGRAYTIGEHFGWLRQAGCPDPQHSVLPNGTPVIWAQKPT